MNFVIMSPHKPLVPSSPPYTLSNLRRCINHHLSIFTSVCAYNTYSVRRITRWVWCHLGCLVPEAGSNKASHKASRLEIWCGRTDRRSATSDASERASACVVDFIRLHMALFVPAFGFRIGDVESLEGGTGRRNWNRPLGSVLDFSGRSGSYVYAF
jgi:hypothetical protein